ncbi:MAG: trypsin-like peptidase domain-containing protein [Bacteroidota bacterium]
MKKTLSILLIASIGGLISLSVYKFLENRNPEKINNQETQLVQPQPSYKFANLTNQPENTVDFTLAAEITVNAVVHVKTVYEGETYRYYDPFYDFLWGLDRREHEYKTPPKMGFGSGVIISEDGYIVTNNHVIENADNIEVILNDQRTYEAKLIGTDPSTDLSLLKIAGSGLPHIIYGNSDDAKVGEWVLAVGNPYNLTSTVTAGIISAKGRNINILQDKFKIESFIQTDAVVNRGNSGGALVNTKGQLIGINSAILSNTGSYTGYSFAIPVNIVKKVVNDLSEFGEVQRAFIGVTIRNLDAEFASEHNINEIKGIYVTSLTDGGAAKDAGIKEGDIITKINDIEVNNVPELQEQIGRYRPGDKIQVLLKRKTKEITKQMILKNKLGNTKIIKEDKKKYFSVLGADFEPVTSEEKTRLNIINGLKIVNLDGGKLRSTGIKQGFIITKIDKKQIYTIEDLTSALENKKGGILIEGIYPNGMRAYYGFGL